jgi:simple sugar transport system ATP-binding protein
VGHASVDDSLRRGDGTDGETMTTTELDSAVVTPAPVVEAIGVSKRFGATQALTDVSFAIPREGCHGLVGRNGSGKSTLVAVLTGLLKPDSGSVLFSGEPAPPMTARELWRAQLACVYQKSTIIASLSVAENVFLNAYVGRGSFVNWKAVKSQARKLLSEWGIDVDVDTLAGDLPVGQRQLVEIVRALRLGTRCIILDEPTAQLEASEIAELFDHINRLQAGGVSFLYISHHLEEIYQICDSVTVLRDGRLVASSLVAEMPEGMLVDTMCGQETGAVSLSCASPGAASRELGEPMLTVRGLGLEGRFSDVDIEIRAGECVGLAGLTGSGKSAVADAIVGLVRPDSGEVLVQGRPVPRGRVDRATDLGIGFLPGDRQIQGFAPNLSIEENVTMPVARRFGPAGFMNLKRRRARADELVEATDVRLASTRQSPTELSGGNQQKTVLARALSSDPKVLLLVDPTVGVDVASKKALMEMVRDSDVAALLVSDDLEELAICNRVLVMFAGKIVAELAAGWDDRDLVAKIEGVSRQND